MWSRIMWVSLQVAVLLASLYALTHAENRNSEDERPGSVHVRRDTASGVLQQYTRLSRRESHLDIHLVEAIDQGLRRRALDYGATKWNKTVCFAFDKNYTDTDLRIMVRRTFNYISSRLCLTFVDISDTLDPSDPNWGIKNGCQSNAYIHIANVLLCTSGVGAGMGNSPVNTGVCKGFYIALHEILHALTCTHVQEATIAPSYISLMPANILKDYLYAYLPRANLPTEYYDAVSTLHYEPDDFQQNGDATFVCVWDDMCVGANDLSSEDIIFLELNQRYKCKEYACGNANVDCYPGYYAKVNGACQCVCPSRLDPATKCKTFINGPNPRVKWPTPATVLAGGEDSSCSSGMAPTGWLTFCQEKAGIDDGPVPFPVQDKTTVHLPFCSTTDYVDEDFYSWPIAGQFCLVKPKCLPCGGVFNDYAIEFTSKCDVQHNGSIGDVTVDGRRVQIKLCCKSEILDMMNDLPNDKPFRLFTKFYCPNVRGMRSYNYRPRFQVPEAKVYGGPAVANTYAKSYGFYWDLCYYMPPTYDCSQNFSLGITQRSVTFNTPGYPTGRVADKRCFYCFNSEEAAHFKLTFLTFDLDADDLMLYNRFNQWQENSKVDNSLPPTDLISEKNMLCVEYWSGYKSVSNAGASFRVETVLRGELCYNHSTRGANYLGDKNISQNYEPCLNWKDTRECFESPYQTMDGLLEYYEGNSCRNPGGKLRLPWCFVYQNGTSCAKRYCDVCNLQQVVDALSTSVCASYIASTPNFCTQAIQRYGCAKSCSLVPVTSDCPSGYIRYGPRCFYFSTTRKTRAQAEKLCRKQGSGSTLYQVRSLDDQIFIRQYVHENGGGDTWISGALDAASSKWLYTDTNIHVAYSNWSVDAVTDNKDKNCVFLAADKTSPARDGSWQTTRCLDSTVELNFACQTERIQTCGQPTPPSHGVVVNGSQDFYYEGDRVAIGCSDGSSSDVLTYIMCKGGKWTKLQSVCTACPAGWLLYGKLCVFYNNEKATITDAEAFCRGQGPNGTLFRVTSDADYNFSREVRQLRGNGRVDHMYISGRCLSKGEWTYTDSNQAITYSNMPAKCSQGNYMYVYREYSTSGAGGSLRSTSSLTNLYTSICQKDSREVKFGDIYDTCQAALEENPGFCETDQAEYFCPASCGLGENPKICREPVSKTYTRKSSASSVKAGEQMTFACKDGYVLTGGDTARACGLGGQWLGQEPVCTSNSPSVDVGLSLLTPRLRYLDTKLAVLLDRDELRVPFAGRITAWYCYARAIGDITFFVFRKKGSSYSFVGSNKVKCHSQWIWGVYISAGEQIKVQKGDVIGVYSTSVNSLYVSDCSSFDLPDRSWPLPVATAGDEAAVQTADFTMSRCMRPSVGYQVTR